MKYIIALLLIITVCSCEVGDDSITSRLKAEFIIADKYTGTTEYGKPYTRIIIENVGAAVGYNVSCTVHAKQGNTIIDSGFAYFADGGDIEAGERAQEKAVFFGLSTFAGYKLKYSLSWLER